MSSDKTNQMKDNPLLGRLYDLPIDLKVKIFQMAIQSNMAQWLMDHKGGFGSSLALLDSTLNLGYIELKGYHKDGFWAGTQRPEQEGYEDAWYFMHSPLCNKIDGYEEVYLPPHFNNFNNYHRFWKREWRDKPDYYWYCDRCRCTECDLVKDAKLEHDASKKRQRSKVVRERCTRILEGMSADLSAAAPQRFMVERAIELVDNHYLNDPE
jgi:hypothetical protein